jgi:hypothetical protein
MEGFAGFFLRAGKTQEKIGALIGVISLSFSIRDKECRICRIQVIDKTKSERVAETREPSGGLVKILRVKSGMDSGNACKVRTRIRCTDSHLTD